MQKEDANVVVLGSRNEVPEVQVDLISCFNDLCQHQSQLESKMDILTKLKSKMEAQEDFIGTKQTDSEIRSICFQLAEVGKQITCKSQLIRRFSH